MVHKAVWVISVCLIGLALAVTGGAQAAPDRAANGSCPPEQGGYVYQGRLSQGGLPAEGSFDFQFDFYSNIGDVSPTFTTRCTAVPVESGLFSVSLDTQGRDIANTYLGISIGPLANLVTLTPRQKVAAVPLASFASNIKAPLALTVPSLPASQDVLRVTAGNTHRPIYAESTNMEAIHAKGTGTYTAIFEGNILVTGTVDSLGSSIIQVPHPLDPQGKTLNLTAPASPEMLVSIGNNVTLDEKGQAVVDVPDWFEAGAIDYRYSLTPIGASAPGLYIAQEVSGGSFAIAGGQPGLKVSWSVSGVRSDAYALEHPLVVEQPASGLEQQP